MELTCISDEFIYLLLLFVVVINRTLVIVLMSVEYIKSRPTSLLGYGDVGVPGLLVTLCLKFDLNYRKGNCLKIYYATSGIGTSLYSNTLK